MNGFPNGDARDKRYQLVSRARCTDKDSEETHQCNHGSCTDVFAPRAGE